jgi:hypothetical protein
VEIFAERIGTYLLMSADNVKWVLWNRTLESCCKLRDAGGLAEGFSKWSINIVNWLNAYIFSSGRMHPQLDDCQITVDSVSIFLPITFDNVKLDLDDLKIAITTVVQANLCDRFRRKIVPMFFEHVFVVGAFYLFICNLCNWVISTCFYCRCLPTNIKTMHFSLITILLQSVCANKFVHSNQVNFWLRRTKKPKLNEIGIQYIWNQIRAHTNRRANGFSVCQRLCSFGALGSHVRQGVWRARSSTRQLIATSTHRRARTHQAPRGAHFSHRMHFYALKNWFLKN